MTGVMANIQDINERFFLCNHGRAALSCSFVLSLHSECFWSVAIESRACIQNCAVCLVGMTGVLCTLDEQLLRLFFLKARPIL